MTDWQQSIAGTIEGVEARFDRLKRRLGHALDGHQTPIIIPYRSYGSHKRLLVRGRVLEDKQITAGLAEDSIWQNLLNTYRRLESDEIPGARVEVSYGDARAEAVCDEEGHFRTWLEGLEGRIDGGWLQVNLRLLEPTTPDTGPFNTVGDIMIPNAGARFGVISDIDDTVMQSYATELIRMARLTFLGNATTRLPFPGVASFYRALHEGEGADNPLFYVSSSPWNLYDLIVDFFRLQGIPRGPMFLRDWGINREELFPIEHTGHKLEAVERLFEFYESLPFILIGDSGQQDPEIYAEIVRRHSQRVLAVYIRNVSDGGERDEAVLELAKEVSAAGSTLILAEDTFVMAQHAQRNGWIAEEAIRSIANEIEVDTDDEGGPLV